MFLRGFSSGLSLVQPFPFPLWYLQPLSASTEAELKAKYLGSLSLPVIVPCSRDALLPPDHPRHWQQQMPALSRGDHP